ncbi:MAG: 1,4-dihydroxy-6-naphthoate synthase [Saprospiraceae bacterium]
MTIGFSPCPNDTFIFDALVHGKVDTEGLSFEPVIEDVEALNRRAFAGDIDVTKLSYHALAHLTDRFALLHAGSALGRNCGPLLVARAPLQEADLSDAAIAIPGRMTTANFLLGLAYPQATHRTELLFSDIEDAVLDGRFDAGLLIHENRFTYEQKGLVKLRDLGAYWEELTGFPIPLGGIAVNRRVDHALWPVIDRVLRRSVAYAFEHPDDVMPYVRMHAQAMDVAVMKAHIDLYVTAFTLDLGTEGRAAVDELFRRGSSLGLSPRIEDNNPWL